MTPRGTNREREPRATDRALSRSARGRRAQPRPAPPRPGRSADRRSPPPSRRAAAAGAARAKMAVSRGLRRCQRAFAWLPVLIIALVVLWSYYAYVFELCLGERPAGRGERGPVLSRPAGTRPALPRLACAPRVGVPAGARGTRRTAPGWGVGLVSFLLRVRAGGAGGGPVVPPAPIAAAHPVARKHRIAGQGHCGVN